jgi:hypothetical protein
MGIFRQLTRLSVSNFARMTVTQRVLFPWLAVLVTLSALLFATLAGGPLVGVLFGVPAGFPARTLRPVPPTFRHCSYKPSQSALAS